MIPNVDYKGLNTDGASPYQGFVWPLPVYEGGTWVAAGKWVTWDGPLVACASGIHYCTQSQVVHWLQPTLYAFEAAGETVNGGNKSICSRGRLLYKIDAWNEQTQRLFAAECAERVLPIYEKEHPSDTRPRDAILASRQFAFGLIGAAAWAAARDAARAAAWAAAWAAARDAARAAARDAAWDAARDAARAAAWAAAWAAARDAAWDAARDAAWDAAWAAARDAECQVQTDIFMRALWDNEAWTAEQREEVERG
jgi:hypothetical protein